MLDLKIGSRVMWHGYKWNVVNAGRQWVFLEGFDIAAPRSELKPVIRSDVYAAHQLIEKIGGVDKAALYSDCDGFVNGEFIRGDDVRRAVRLIGGT